MSERSVTRYRCAGCGNTHLAATPYSPLTNRPPCEQRARRAPCPAFEAGNVDSSQADVDERICIAQTYPGRLSPAEQRQAEAAERSQAPSRYRVDPRTGGLVLVDEGPA
jgi:hypothetical protein